MGNPQGSPEPDEYESVDSIPPFNEFADYVMGDTDSPAQLLYLIAAMGLHQSLTDAVSSAEEARAALKLVQRGVIGDIADFTERVTGSSYFAVMAVSHYVSIITKILELDRDVLKDAARAERVGKFAVAAAKVLAAAFDPSQIDEGAYDTLARAAVSSDVEPTLINALSAIVNIKVNAAVDDETAALIMRMTWGFFEWVGHRSSWRDFAKLTARALEVFVKEGPVKDVKWLIENIDYVIKLWNTWLFSRITLRSINRRGAVKITQDIEDALLKAFEAWVRALRTANTRDPAAVARAYAEEASRRLMPDRVGEAVGMFNAMDSLVNFIAEAIRPRLMELGVDDPVLTRLLAGLAAGAMNVRINVILTSMGARKDIIETLSRAISTVILDTLRDAEQYIRRGIPARAAAASVVLNEATTMVIALSHLIDRHGLGITSRINDVIRAVRAVARRTGWEALSRLTLGGMYDELVEQVEAELRRIKH